MGSVTSPEIARRSPAGAGAAKTAEAASKPAMNRKIKMFRQKTIRWRM